MYHSEQGCEIVIALEASQKDYTTSEMRNMGYSYYKISQMEENGRLHRINRTTYENLSYKGDENDFINAAAYVPDGVICLMSAARYYELTNFLPDVIDVAIDRKKKVSTLPDWPEIKIFCFAPLRMNIGVTEIMEGAGSGVVCSGCTNMESIILPETITYICNYAFRGCDNLQTLTIQAVTPPTFSNDSYLPHTATIKVPSSSVAAYKAAEYWKDYADNIVGY
jgi:hypothetical protein